MIKGAIFDLDGTLLDSMEVWEYVGARYLRSRGIEPRPGLRQIIKPMSQFQAAAYFQSAYGLTLSVDEIVEGINATAAQDYEETIPLKPGVTDFLRRLAERGVKMCVATATDVPLAEAAMRRCGILGYFSGIFTCGAVGHAKDEPDIYRAALQHLGYDKKETVVFEDALYAAKTAKNDGFIVAAVYDKFEQNWETLRELADYVITDFRTTETDLL